MEIYSEVSFRHVILGRRLRLVIEISPLLSLLEVKDKQYSILLTVLCLPFGSQDPLAQL